LKFNEKKNDKEDRSPLSLRFLLLTLGLSFFIFLVKNLNSNESSGGYFMNVKPLGDRILIKIKESETKTAGGIIIPQTAQEKTQTGVVVAVGTDTDVIKVKAGDEVMYDKYAGTQIKIQGSEHLIVKMSDVLAVLE